MKIGKNLQRDHSAQLVEVTGCKTLSVCRPLERQAPELETFYSYIPKESLLMAFTRSPRYLLSHGQIDTGC
jgi:hypothetical protein